MMYHHSNSSTAENKTEIALKGSVEVVSDFFFTAINSILYQRGTFHRRFWLTVQRRRIVALRLLMNVLFVLPINMQTYAR
jgi:hypothetical protein